MAVIRSQAGANLARNKTLTIPDGEIMEYVSLGKTGLKVSRICPGCISYGAPASGAAVGEPVRRRFLIIACVPELVRQITVSAYLFPLEFYCSVVLSQPNSKDFSHAP